MRSGPVFQKKKIFVLMLLVCCWLVRHTEAQTAGLPGSPPFSTLPQLVVQIGHSNGIRSVTFSHDGKLVLTGSDDHNACLWDAGTGVEIRRFVGHRGGIASVAFSPDDKYVLTGSSSLGAANDRTARIWDIATGKQIREFDNQLSGVEAVAFSPDGKQIITGSGHDGEDNVARLWRTEDSSREMRKFVGHTKPVTALAFSPDGRYLLTGSYDNTARLWNVATGTEIRRYNNHTDAVVSVQFSHDGKLALSAGRDGTAQVWETDTAKEQREFPVDTTSPGTHMVYSAIFSPDDKSILTGSFDKTARLWEVSSGREIQKFLGHSGGVASAAFSPDGKVVLTGCGYFTNDDNTARLWNAETGQEIRQFIGRAVSVYSARFSPDQKLIATACSDATARIWDITTGQEVRRLMGHSVDVWSVAFSPDSQSVITGSGDTTARIWDVNTGKSKLELAVPDDERVWSVAFSPDGKQVLTASNNMARLWDAASGQMIRTFAGHRYAVMSVAFSPDGRFVLTGGGYGKNDDNTARLWSVETGNELKRLEGHGDVILSVAFSPNGRYALTGGGEGPTSDTIVRLWDTTTYELVRKFEGHTGTVGSVAFSPDGKRIVTGSWDGSVIVWNVETGLPGLPHPLLGHSGMVDDARFSPDGRFILTGSRGDGTARIWSTSTGDELCELISFKQSNQVVSNQDTTQGSTAQDWFVIDHGSRFDSNNLESINGLRWVMPDDPFTPISPEIFMRPYYEPRLLPRLLENDDFKEVPALADLNRVQPKITITEVKTDGPDTVAVTVEVANVEHRYQREKNPVGESGAKDLRLFRDGQLVSYRDGELLRRQRGAGAGCEPIAGSVKRCKAVFGRIRLPRQEGIKDVEFSAYAFNSSDVKSETSRFPFKFTRELAIKKGRVYLITVGVSKYENPDWNLEFAANDAHLIDETLAAKLRATGDYEDVISVMLTSEVKVISHQQELIKTATKDNFAKVMRLLAGDKLPESETREISNAQRIEKATPEDVVMIFYSSHGYRDEERFYLFPYDTGRGQGRDPEAVVPRSISSDDLYQWLRDIDAGDVVLVIDACHAAAVTGREFKPGPMGSRGMGQLAYDKGMRILAATQPDTTAAEVDSLDPRRKIQHGLLTYALIADGLIDRKADMNDDKTILMSEWLEFGVADVPMLFKEAAKSQNANAENATAEKPVALSQQRGAGQVRFISRGDGDTSTQQPSLFDFTSKLRRKRQLVIQK